ncbi:MAG: hypothetical protein AAGF11_39280 [Myxococcota bacterium]
MTQSNKTHRSERAGTLVHSTGPLAILATLSVGVMGTTMGGCVLSAMDGANGQDGSTGADDGADGGSDGGSGDTGESTTGGISDGCAEVQDKALAVLETHCAACHSAPASQGGFGFVTDRDKLILSGKVIPGSVDDSPLYARMASGSMPPTTSPSQPDDGELQAVAQWIEQCAPVPPEAECDDQEWISTSTMIDTMLSDITVEVDPSDRPFTRYLTLTHLHNVGVCDSELEEFRFGLSKAINSLSLDPLISKPEPIDAGRTIYRIDLRDYDWEAAQGVDKWEMLVDQSPYAFRMLDDDAEVLQGFAQTDVPFMPADWLVHDASEPPLYYDLVDIPTNLRQLEANLGIELERNILNGEVARAGFLSSGVSQNNRMFERHQMPFSPGGAYWLSYDFASNEGEQNLFAEPLDFDEDGGEVIFNLPNGLQAYVVAAANGDRLDEAPIQIVSDPLQPDKTVRAGISCMSCHTNGMQLKTDELRDYVATSLDFNDDVKEIVEDLYVDSDEMDSLLQLSNQTFNNAVAATWDGDTDIEPIFAVYAKWEAPVDLKRAAAELGVAPNALLSQLGQLDPTYAPLLNAVIDRDTFEAKFAESVCLLNLGEADDPACLFSDDPDIPDDSGDSGGTGDPTGI